MRKMYLLVLWFLGACPMMSFLNAQCSISASNLAPCAGEIVSFNAGIGNNYSWDFNDDGVIDAWGNPADYSFQEVFTDWTYTVKLYQDGIVCDQLNVNTLGLPDPSIDVVPGNATLEDTLIRICSAVPQATLQIFNASTTIPDNQSYTINWGDGSIENLDNTSFPNSSFISHTYSAFGYFELTVSVLGINGCTASKTYTFYNGSNPSVGLGTPGNSVGLCAPATLEFPISGTASNPTGTEYFFYVGGELIETYTQANVPSSISYTFLETSCGLETATGNFQNAFDVQLIASNPCGSSQATVEPIEISTPPEPEFLSDQGTLVCQEDVITITDNSSNVNEVSSGNPSICESSISPSWTISPGVIGIDWNLVSGNIFNSSQIQIQFLIPGNYTVTMTINSASCGSFSYQQEYEVLESPRSGFNLALSSGATPALADECIPTAAIFSNQSTGDSLSYNWLVSPPTGWYFVAGFDASSENMELIFTESGSYFVQLTTSNPCRSASWDTTIIIADIPLVSLDPIPDFCETATLDFSPSNVEISANGGSITNYHWEFPGGSPGQSSQAYPTGIQYHTTGEHIVQLTIENQCGLQIISDTFNIQEAGVLTLSPNQSLCQDENGFQLTANPAGGIWSGNGVSPNGWFVPTASTVGNNVLKYAFLDGGCDLEGSVTITVFATPAVSAGESQSVCENDEPILITGGQPLGGMWSSNNDGVITATNAFDPIASGPGVYTLTYAFTDLNGCSDSDAKTMVVYELPLVEAGPDQDLCDTPNDVQLTGFNPAGGIWTGPGVSPSGVFQSINGPGLYTLFYTYTNPATSCVNLDSLQINITESQSIEAGPNDSLCIEDGLLYFEDFSPATGTWYGPGIIDSLNGVFDPLLSGGGSHEIFYTYGSGTCQVTDSKTIVVIDLTNVGVGDPIAFCLMDEPYRLVAAGPNGGIWSGPGIIDPVHGVFDPALAQAGVHTIEYRFDHPSVACSASASMEVTVYAVDPPNFDLPNVACQLSTLQMINLSNPAYSSEWNFGDGQTSIETEPIHLYEEAGNYTIQLIVTSPQGCKDTMSQELLVTESPKPVFILDNYEGCAPFEVTFTNQSIGFDVDFAWDFGNGQTSNLVNPDPVTYFPGTQDTTYIVTLTTRNLCGEKAYNAAVLAKASPYANFGLSPVNLCSPLEVAFANISTGSATDYYWDFGNGETSTDSMPANRIFVADSLETNYTILMIASNSCGVDTAYQDLIVPPADVQAFFNTSDRVGCQPHTVEFYNFASPGAHIDWDFGDGNGSNTLEPVHTFTEPGHYKVIQYASNLCGFDSVSVDIIVLPSPEIKFSHESFACLGSEITFTNESPNISGAFWDFGDGNTSMLSSPVHAYENSGVYTVTLTGTSLFNQCPNSYSSEIIVQALPVANFEPAEPFGCAPFNTTFINQTVQGTFYIWDFGDGTTSVEESPNHTFAEPGLYEVELIATDAFGCSNDTTLLNVLVHPNPTAQFSFDQNLLCRLPVAIQFENTSIDGDAFSWDFGDDSKSEENTPVHYYQEAGTFNISLIASNQFNCRDTFLQTITTHPEPIADFEILESSGCSPLEVRFENFSENVNTYSWQFGDFASSEEAQPVQVFSEAGRYDIQLIAGIDNICFDTLLLEGLVEVQARAFASFEIVESNTDLANGEFELKNLSTDATEYFWDFGDGNSSEQMNPIHRYTNNGARQIYLEATNEYGCKDDTLLTLIPPLFSGLFIPNGFSPEQGIGDVRVFRPAGVGLKEFQVQIFSPYGQLLWESTALEEGIPSEAWDGTYNGKLLPQDMYVWKAFGIFEDGRVWAGQANEKGKQMTMGTVVLLR